MKNNILLLCLDKVYSRELGKKLSDELELFFVDINDILEYNLINSQMLKNAGKAYFEKEKQKVLKGFADYENSVFCANFELLSQKNNLEKLKNNAIAIYLRLTEDTIGELQKSQEMQHILVAFDEEDKFCSKNADIVINASLDEENSLSEIKKGILNYFNWEVVMIEEQCVNELRVLSAEMITNAGSGHPGIALGSAPILYSLYANCMAVNPDDPYNFNRDRFVLSAGHGSSILYSTLHAMGYKISTDDLKKFRTCGSITPGHPEYGITPGVDSTTGPLGQGIANAVGMAIAEKHFAAIFNKKDAKLFDSTIYCLTGDGCLMEGISYEALSLAGTLNLDNFVLIYDCNKTTIEGKIDIAFCDDIELRFKSIGFDIFKVKNGNSTQEISKAILSAKKSKRPAIVVVPTIIGYGSRLADSEKSHGSPLSVEMLDDLRQTLCVNRPEFELSDKVKEHFKKVSRDAQLRLFSKNKENKYKEKYPKEYKKFKAMFDENTYTKLAEKLKNIDISAFAAGATRDINHVLLQEVAKIVPNLFGGSADVAPSTKAFVKEESAFSKTDYLSSYMHYGIREHAMAGISNGIALFGGLIPYQSCFLSFFDYLKPSLRMSALIKLRVLSMFSHDSILVGQDGPTHQPIEQIPTLRNIPNMIVSRPYNAAEILATYIWMLNNKMPINMILSKDKMELLNSSLDDALMGGYIIKDAKKAQITLVGTGTDVDKCLQIAEILQQNSVSARVVSMPCVSIFESQSMAYQKSVFNYMPKVFIEASAENYWYKMASDNDLVLNITEFGTSGKPSEVEKFMKFDAKSLAKKILSWHKKNI